MLIRKDRPFQAPRQAKPRYFVQETEDDDVPIAQTLQKTNKNERHRQDKSKKTMTSDKMLEEKNKSPDEEDAQSRDYGRKSD